MFKGILITKDESGYKAAVQQIDDAVLPEGDVTVRVEWSTLNYKDGLALTGKAPVVRRFPLVPGIDFAGTVSASSNPAWKAGDRVVLNGWGVGETHCGGLAEVARVRGEWLVPLPAAFTARQAMAIGTAGYTAMLCVLALERHGIRPADGEILVTGANGGVGGVAIALLSQLGYTVVAFNRPSCRSRTPESAGGDRGHRARRTLGAGQAARQGALGRRRRHGGQPDAGQCLRDDEVSRRRGCLWPGRRHGFPGDGGAVHPARRDAVRHRQRHGAAGGASGSLGAPGHAISTSPSSMPSRPRSVCRKPSPPAPACWKARCAGG